MEDYFVTHYPSRQSAQAINVITMTDVSILTRSVWLYNHTMVIKGLLLLTPESTGISISGVFEAFRFLG